MAGTKPAMSFAMLALMIVTSLAPPAMRTATLAVRTRSMLIYAEGVILAPWIAPGLVIIAARV
jgi:hypothetical protein